MPVPDVWITPVAPAGPPVGFGLADAGETGSYTSGGYIWTPVDRPRRKPYLEFTSDQLTQLKLPLIIDGSDASTSIEPVVGLVHGWIRPTAGTGEPPILRITGPVDQAGVVNWVVQTAQWGTGQIRRRDGSLLQQDVVLTLIEYTGSMRVPPTPTLAAQASALLGLLAQTGVQIPAQLASLIQQLPQLLAAASPTLASDLTTQIASFLASIPNNAAGATTVVTTALPQLAQVLPSLGGGRIYWVRDGDTLWRIAARELGDHRKWRMIAVLNGIRDPRTLQINQRLLLP